MTLSKKGKKGFQKLPEYLKQTHKYNYKMTKAEFEAIDSYCKANSITKMTLFQTALNNFYEANGITISHKEDNNPNQLRLDD